MDAREAVKPAEVSGDAGKRYSALHIELSGVPLTMAITVDQDEEPSRLTEEALADVDAGRVIDHQAVKAWAESLSTETPLPVVPWWN